MDSDDQYKMTDKELVGQVWGSITEEQAGAMKRVEEQEHKTLLIDAFGTMTTEQAQSMRTLLKGADLSVRTAAPEEQYWGDNPVLQSLHHLMLDLAENKYEKARQETQNINRLLALGGTVDQEALRTMVFDTWE